MMSNGRERVMSSGEQRERERPGGEVEEVRESDGRW